LPIPQKDKGKDDSNNITLKVSVLGLPMDEFVYITTADSKYQIFFFKKKYPLKIQN